VVNKAYHSCLSLSGHILLSATRKFEDYNLQFEIDERLEYNLLQNDLISNQTNVLAVVNNVVPLKYELFENDALIFKSLQSKYLTILKNQTPLLRVHYSGFPHLGIWTKINAPFLCIEPWFGYSDSVESTGNLMEKKASK
jgi:galactose mutarotase-like enzyme